MSNNKSISTAQQDELLGILKARFEKNITRHKDIKWADVYARLQANAGKLWSVNEMEVSGGEPDVIGYDEKTGEYLFADCAAESPKGRRSLCYDYAAWQERKEHRPESNAMDIAAEMGIQILTEDEYRSLQQLGKFDLKTSSWVATPETIRKHGGAIFCDRRYDHVFTYHNGASSYYAARGFRGMLKV